MPLAVVQLLAGLAILTVGGHYIVRGAVSLALLARVSTAVIGLTVVAFGTSLPELAVSFTAAAEGSTDIAYANVVGSSIFNVAVILGITALIRPVLVRPETRQFEHPGMFIVLALCLVLAQDRIISPTDGKILLAGFVGFVTLTIVRTKRLPIQRAAETSFEIQEVRTSTTTLKGWGVALGYVTMGIVGLWAGSEFMVNGAVTIAERVGISERLIGLTIIAMGTSLPELAASAMAARHGEDAIALSNLMGSNIFNILAVLGVTSAVFPVPVHARAVALDNWVMLGFSAALFPILWTGRDSVDRWHGALLLTGFFVYFGVLIVVG